MVLLGTKSIKRIKLFSLVLAALCVLVLCACTSNESMLMGKWRGKLLVGSGDFYMAFNSDGSYIESTDKGIKNQGTWSLSKSTITVLGSDGVVLTYTIEELKKDKLILVAPIFNMKFQMEKVEDGNTSASNNIPINPIIGAIIAIALLAIIILFVSKKKKNNKISHSVKPSGKSFCGNCGTKLEDGVRFCPNCGKNLSEPIAADNVEQSVEYGEEEESPIKKYLPYILGAIALIAICGGGWWYSNSSKAPQVNNEVAVAEAVEADSIAVEDTEKSSERDIKLITEWYDYVFGKKEISDDVLDKFLSSKVKKSLWTEDYDGCYEYWKFRTIAQDYDPNVGDISKIEDISVNSDGWYEVKYLDMGYNGKTTIKIDNTKIVDFVPDSSWSNNDSSDGNRADNETIADDNSDNSSSAYNSSNTSSSARTFANEQYVVGYLANQTFRSSNGFTIRFDGSGRMYAEGDFAGVVSVLYFNSKSAMLRYGGGQYTEGRVRVDIVGDKLQLKDPEDGTIYYQR